MVVTASDWTKMVTNEFYALLHAKLSDTEFHDNDARRHALQEQIEWYEQNMENLIEEKKKKGKMTQSMHKVLRPLLAMVSIRHLYTNSAN